MYRPITLNIWCHENGKVTSGTATIIHPSGILLTNAHIIEPIEDTENCVLRSWNPFDNVAKFKTLFIPNQAKTIEGTEGLPQYDFAFIKTTELLSQTGVPPWPYAPVFVGEPQFVKSMSLFIFSYATEFVSYEISVKGIPLLFSSLIVKDPITIDNDDTDIDGLLLEGGITNQAGSSGGPLVDGKKSLVAMLSFVGKGKTTGEREGIAILASYIDRVMRSETGQTLAEFLTAHAQ